MMLQTKLQLQPWRQAVVPPPRLNGRVLRPQAVAQPTAGAGLRQGALQDVADSLRSVSKLQTHNQPALDEHKLRLQSSVQGYADDTLLVADNAVRSLAAIMRVLTSFRMRDMGDAQLFPWQALLTLRTEMQRCSSDLEQAAAQQRSQLTTQCRHALELQTMLQQTIQEHEAASRAVQNWKQSMWLYDTLTFFGAGVSIVTAIAWQLKAWWFPGWLVLPAWSLITWCSFSKDQALPMLHFQEQAAASAANAKEVLSGVQACALSLVPPITHLLLCLDAANRDLQTFLDRADKGCGAGLVQLAHCTALQVLAGDVLQRSQGILGCVTHLRSVILQASEVMAAEATSAHHTLSSGQSGREGAVEERAVPLAAC